MRMQLRMLIRPQHEEAFVTQTMSHVDRARTRMPLVCTVISVLVWAVFAAICFTSLVFAIIDSAPDSQAPQSNTAATNVSAPKPRDPYATESRVRPGRRF
jgi:hypothetical protein